MNMKRYIIAVVATYFVMWGLATAMVFADRTASWTAILRDEAAQMALMGWAAGGYVVITAIFCYIFVKGRDGDGWQEGLRYGVLIGLFWGP